jgi:uncharacterized Rossmann fold enzyme
MLDEASRRELPVTVSDTHLLIAPETLSEILGWELKPQGLCRDSACFPVADSDGVVIDGAIDLEGFARTVGRPLALDREHRVAALGTAAATRADAMESLVAPDFRLPDLDGRMHTLSEHLGKKVFLVAHASW